jgi:hypothetical protein
MSTLTAAPNGAKMTLCISFALIFLCGAVTGALVTNRAHSGRVVDRGTFNSHIEVERLHKKLNLTDEQTRQLSMILDDVAKYYDNVLSDGQTRVMQILDDGQKAKFRQLLATEGH